MLLSLLAKQLRCKLSSYAPAAPANKRIDLGYNHPPDLSGSDHSQHRDLLAANAMDDFDSYENIPTPENPAQLSLDTGHFTDLHIPALQSTEVSTMEITLPPTPQTVPPHISNRVYCVKPAVKPLKDIGMDTDILPPAIRSPVDAPFVPSFDATDCHSLPQCAMDFQQSGEGGTVHVPASQATHDELENILEAIQVVGP